MDRGGAGEIKIIGENDHREWDYVYKKHKFSLDKDR
jgi:hypothetical protein